MEAGIRCEGMSKEGWLQVAEVAEDMSNHKVSRDIRWLAQTTSELSQISS